MNIIANHAHLLPDKSWLPGDADLLLSHMDFCGVEQVVVFPPFGCQFQDDRKAANLWALEQVRQHPDRFLPAGTLFPLAADAIEMLRMLHGEGVRLIKIHPSIDVYDVADPAARPFYAEAERLGMILNYHTGPHGTRLELANPEKFDNLAHEFPTLRFVLEHLGGRAYAELMLAIIANHRRGNQARPRVFGGLTSILNKQTHGMWYIEPQRLQDAIQTIGADYFIFGLDFPWNEKEANRQAIEIIRGMTISEADQAKILGGNLMKALNDKSTTSKP